MKLEEKKAANNCTTQELKSKRSRSWRIVAAPGCRAPLRARKHEARSNHSAGIPLRIFFSLGFTLMSGYMLLFVAQGVGRVGEGCTEGLHAYGEQGDEYSAYGCKHIDQHIHVHMICEGIQPLTHDEPGNGPGDEAGDEDKRDDLARQQGEDVRYRGAEHFANTDLFDALQGIERGQAEQTEAGNEDSHAGEDGEELALFLIIFIEEAVAVAHDLVFERARGEEFFPFLFEVGDGLLEVGAIDPDGEVIVGTVADAENHGHDLLVERFEVEVFDDADELSFGVASFEVFADAFVDIFPADLACGGFVDDEGDGVITRYVSREEAACSDVDAVGGEELVIYLQGPEQYVCGHETIAFDDGSVALPVEEAACGDARGAADVLYGGGAGELVVEGVVVIGELGVAAEGDDLVFVVADVAGVEVSKLLGGDGGGDDEHDGDGELGDDEHAAYSAFTVYGSLLAFEYGSGSEGGDDERGVGACEKTDDTSKGYGADDDRPMGGEMKGDGLAREVIHPRERNAGEGGGQYEGKQGDEHGLAEVLADELAFQRTGYFAHAYLFGAFGGAGGGEVYEIETSDEDDEQADDAHHVDVVDVAVHLDLIIEVRAEVDVGYGLDV